MKSPLGVGLILLIVFAGFSSLWNIADTARSEYYAAIAKSMSLNLGNWFFGAFDPAGTVTLDKIPGSYWVPAIFVKLFGFSTWSITVPNALAVIAAAVITVFAVRRVGGTSAGLIAGFLIATTPILTAVSRANQPQSYFVLAMALTLLAATKAFETGKRRHLVFTGLFIALAFNFYMLEAWAVWPAIILGWLLLSRKTFADKTLGKKLTDLLIAGSISLFASLLWPIVVAMVPSASRPFIGGTFTNNPFEMIFGYNGLGRFSATAADAGSSYQTFTPHFSGEPSLTRLFNEQLAGQIAWMLPTALVAIVILWVCKTNRALLVALITWFATFAFMFSAVEGMHQFYTSSLAVPAAALVGLAVAEARRANLIWAQVALVVSSAVTAIY
ncbi:MAG: glycosyltransferase family 39 protein, partial [Actinomycetes bacterium]